MINLAIDERPVAVEPGMTILEAARSQGIAIPTLCLHPALKAVGTCKLCAVEVHSAAGRASVVLACLFKVKEGMAVFTRTPRVHQARTTAIERLHAMAPLSTRIREIAAAEGVTLPPLPDGCIRCRLCIRVCKDVVGQSALHMQKIDGQESIAAIADRCIGCGTCANLCPTQAIRIEDYDGIRSIIIRNEIIGRHPLTRCQGCGKYFATDRHLRLVEQRTEPHPPVKEAHHYCPTCAKLFSDRLRGLAQHLQQTRFNQNGQALK